MTQPVRIGVGGWSFDPWEETFYPAGLPKSRQLDYMSRVLTAVEVNATYYSSFKPDTFAKWRDATPGHFRFSLKAHRFSTVRKTRADMETSINLFLGQGIVELGDKLGPINWQFPATRKFERAHMETFLSLLPDELGGLRLRHALEVRNPTFDDPEFLDLLTEHGATAVYAEDDEFPLIRHEGADFAVARLMRSQANEADGYADAELERLSSQVRDWARTREVYAFFISGAKERNPAAATALQARLGLTPPTAAEADALAGKKTRPAKPPPPAKTASPAKKAAAKKTPANGN